MSSLGNCTTPCCGFGVQVWGRCSCNLGHFASDCSLAYSQTEYASAFQASEIGETVFIYFTTFLFVWRFCHVARRKLSVGPLRHHKSCASRLCALMWRDHQLQALSLQACACMIFAVRILDPNCDRGWFSNTTAELLHNLALLFVLFGSIATTYLFASIMAKFHKPTVRVLFALVLLAFLSLLVFVLTSATYVASTSAQARAMLGIFFNMAASAVVCLIIIGASVYAVTILKRKPGSGIEMEQDEKEARTRTLYLVRFQQVTGFVFAVWGVYPDFAPSSVANSARSEVIVVTLTWITTFMGAIALLWLLGQEPRSSQYRSPTAIHPEPLKSRDRYKQHSQMSSLTDPIGSRSAPTPSATTSSSNANTKSNSFTPPRFAFEVTQAQPKTKSVSSDSL